MLNALRMAVLVSGAVRNVRVDATANRVDIMAVDGNGAGIRVGCGGIMSSVSGCFVVPMPLFSSILSKGVGKVLHIESGPEGVVVDGGCIPYCNPDEFCAVPLFNEAAYHEASSEDFASLINRVVIAVDRDNEVSRYPLGGVLLEASDSEIVGVATNGWRLAKMNIAGQSVGGHVVADALIPHSAMSLMARAVSGSGTVRVAVRPNDVLVATDRVVVYSRLVDGRFPRWRGVFPSEFSHRAIVLVERLYAALRQVSVFVDDEKSRVSFAFGDGRLVLRAGVGIAELSIAHTGPAVVIELNSRFVCEFLRVLEPDTQIVVSFSDNGVVLFEVGGYQYLVMPIEK